MSAVKDKFLELYERQEGRCASCGVKLSPTGGDLEFVVDGDEIIALECPRCAAEEREYMATRIALKRFSGPSERLECELCSKELKESEVADLDANFPFVEERYLILCKPCAFFLDSKAHI